MKRLTTLLPVTLAALLATGQFAAADPESSSPGSSAPTTAPAPSSTSSGNSSFGLAPSAAPQIPSDSPPSTDSPLIPEVAPVNRHQMEKDQYQNMNKTEVAEDKLKKLVQWRVVTAKAERDPGLQAIKARALAAKTDFEQRAIFIDYYTQLFDLIAKIDPTLKKEEVAAKKAVYTSRFVQGRVAPTIDPAIARAQRN